MRIVLFHILLLCAVAKMFAKWTSIRNLMDSIESIRSSLQEAKLDLLNYANNDDVTDEFVFNLDQSGPTISNLVKINGPKNIYEKSKKHSHSPKIVNLKKKHKIIIRGDEDILYNEHIKLKLKEVKNHKENLRNKHEDVDSAAYNPSGDTLFGNYNTVNETDEEKNPDSNLSTHRELNEADVNGASIDKVMMKNFPTNSKFLERNRPAQHLLNKYPTRQNNRSNYRHSREIFKTPYPMNDTLLGFTKTVKEKPSFHEEMKKSFVNKLLRKQKKKIESKEQAQNSIYTRFKRNIQAGYTQDHNTCNQYNKNLEKMWAALIKYIHVKDSLSKHALHNIAVIIKAYLEHQNKNLQQEEVSSKEKQNKKISAVLMKIMKLLKTDRPVKKITEIILQNFKPKYDDEEPDCKEINEETLKSAIALLYKNYVDDIQCHGEYKTGLLRNKSLLRNSPPVESEELTSHLFHNSYIFDRNIMDEAESPEAYNIIRMPAYKFYGKNNKHKRKRTPLSGHNLKPFKKFPRRLPSREKKLITKISELIQHRQKLDKRIDEACVKYATHKILESIRESIKRFINLRECYHDNTLRTLNNKKKSIINKRTNLLSELFVPNIRFDTKFLTDIEIGPEEPKQINKHPSKISGFDEQNAIKKSNLIFILPNKSYNNSLLFKIKDKSKSQNNSMLLRYTPLNKKRQIKRLYYYNVPFLDSSDVGLQKILHSTAPGLDEHLKTNHDAIAINNFILYDIMRNEIDQGNTKQSFITREQHSKDSPEVLARSKMSFDSDVVGNNFHDDIHYSFLEKSFKDTNENTFDMQKGYVELSYLVNYPRAIVYQSPYLVKKFLSYDDFIKASNQLFFSDDNKELLRIIRFLPDNKTQLLFEAPKFKSALEVFNVQDDIKGNISKFPANFVRSDDRLLKHNITNETYIHITRDNMNTENKMLIDTLHAAAELDLLRSYSVNDNTSDSLQDNQIVFTNSVFNNTELVSKDENRFHVSKPELLQKDGSTIVDILKSTTQPEEESNIESKITSGGDHVDLNITDVRSDSNSTYPIRADKIISVISQLLSPMSEDEINTTHSFNVFPLREANNSKSDYVKPQNQSISNEDGLIVDIK